MAIRKVKRLTNGTFSGFTFIEVLVAVLVLGILLTGLTPQLSAGNAEKLDLAASEVVAAVRFARSEAMRTGEVHSIFVDASADLVTVEKVDLSTKPASVESILYHPIKKQPYSFKLASNPATRNVILNPQPPFDFLFAGQQSRLMFDPYGLPVHIDTFTGTTYLLSDAAIKLKHSEQKRKIGIAPYSGRVTVQ